MIGESFKEFISRTPVNSISLSGKVPGDIFFFVWKRGDPAGDELATHEFTACQGFL